MAEILDVVTRLSYDFQGGGLNAANQALEQQLKLTKELNNQRGGKTATNDLIQEAKARDINASAALKEAKATTEVAKAKKLEAQAEQILLKIKENLTKASDKAIALRTREQKQLDELTNDYRQLSLAYNDARAKAQEYSATLGVNHPVALQYQADADRIYQALIKIDQRVGDSRRQVGNYNLVVQGLGKSLNSLNFATSQLLREFTAFTYSFQTGLLALSNNIPIFLDQLTAIRQQGGRTGEILMAIVRSVFSLNGIITIGIGILTVFGGELFKTEKAQKETAKSVEELTAAIIEQNKALQESIRLYRNSRDLGIDAAKRQLNELIALKASEDKIQAARKKVNDLQKNDLQDQIDRYDIIIDRTRTLFEQFSTTTYGGKTFATTEAERRKNIIPELRKTLQETLGITENQAQSEAAAIVNTYGTRNSAIKKYLDEKKILIEQQKDLTSQFIVDTAKANKPENYFRPRVVGKKEYIQSIREIEQETRDAFLDKGTFESLRAGGKAPIVDTKKAESDLKESQRIREQDDERRKKAIEEMKAKYMELAETIVDAFVQIQAAQMRELDFEIAQREKRVEQARILAERGSVDALKSEQEYLDKATQAREAAARKQIQLNALMQASQQALNLTQAVGVILKEGLGGDPYTAAARIAAVAIAIVGAIAATQSAVNSANTPGFKEGVVGIDGKGTSASDSIPARLSKGESVITAKATAKNRDLLELANKGYDLHMLMQPKYQEVAKSNNKQTEKLLQGVIDTVSGLKFRAENRLDRNGVHQLIETEQKIERNRWK